MRTIIVFVPACSAWPKNFFTSLSNVREENGRWIVETDGGWAALYSDDQIWHDYDDDEKREVLEKLPNAEPYVLESNDSSLLGQVIMSAPSRSDGLIDNDHGFIAPIWEIQRRILLGEAWLEISPK